MYLKDEENLIVLNSFEELTYNVKYKLLGEFTHSEPYFDEYSEYLIKSMTCGVYNKVKGKFFSPEYRLRTLSELNRKGITCVTYFSKLYPEFLKHTPCPPIILYCIGNSKLLGGRLFSVVGSRRTQPNVIRACKQISEELTQHFTVVTGIADGADTAAADGALPSGKVISVLGNGFDYVYPSYSEKLMRDIADNGLLVSEYPPEVPPRSFHFPMRNRIIAALGEGTLVVSAGEKSGALITASYAAEYGRELFAFPYGIGVAMGAGCNSLIKKGAYLTENILDIFGVFGLDFKAKQKQQLNSEEQRLYDLICESGEIFVADAAQKMGVPPFKLVPLISSLEIKGLAVRIGGNRYAKV